MEETFKTDDHLPLGRVEDHKRSYLTQSVETMVENEKKSNDEKSDITSEELEKIFHLQKNLEKIASVEKMWGGDQESAIKVFTSVDTPELPQKNGYVLYNKVPLIDRKKPDNIFGLTAKDKEYLKMYEFYKLIRKPYLEAYDIAKAEGYILHPLYLGNKKMPCPTPTIKTIGVRITDPDFFVENKPSNKAVLIGIIDVGGLDINDTGNIKL